jgi:sensor histidine kinase YesM
LALIGFNFLTSNIQNTNGNTGFHLEVRNSIIGFIIMALIAFSNILLLLLFEKQLESRSNITGKKYFLLTSYVVNIVIFNLIIIVNGIVFLNNFEWSGLYKVFVIGILVNTLSLTIQNYVILQDAKGKAEMENTKLKAANAEASNLLLRQQIHPHFLFNSLNVLKSLYKKDPEKAEEYLVCLSDFMRAAISNNNIKIIRLKDEIKLCMDYLELQKIRFGDALRFTVLISDEKLENGFLPSFSIQQLIENAIKHNELTTESPLHLTIAQSGDQIKVTNNLKLKNSTEKSTRSGLANLSERYRLLSYEDLIIEESDDFFSVIIKILSSDISFSNVNHQGSNSFGQR